MVKLLYLYNLFFTLCIPLHLTLLSAKTHGTMADMKADTIKLHPKTHFVLVHGFSSGGWCWFKVKTLMDEAGYKVSCPDLKSAGIDNTNAASIGTFEEYDEPLIHLLSSASEAEKIVLVGTSAGGLSLMHMIHKFPKKIHMAIFVGATMLRNGFLTEQDTNDGFPSDFLKNITVPASEKESTLQKAMKLCTLQDINLAMLLGKPGPLDVLANAKFQEDEGIDEVKRIYIKTKHDLVLTPKQQEAMVNKWPPNGVFTLDSDHSPHLSKHLELFHLLVQAAATDLFRK